MLNIRSKIRLACKLNNFEKFGQIGKTMKKLQWIPNIIVNTSVLVISWGINISDAVKIALTTYGFGCI